MAVTALIARAASRPPLLMAALGSLSGVLSAWIGFAFEPPWLAGVGGVFFLDAGMVPIGVLFAAAVGVGGGDRDPADGGAAGRRGRHHVRLERGDSRRNEHHHRRKR
jgi:hypothetical protein